MPAPGWYPDPSGRPLLRYFDGQHWTPNTAPHPTSSGSGHPQGGSPTGPGNTQQGGATGPGYQYQDQQPGFQQHPGQPGGPPPASGSRRNLWLWVTFGVLVAMILGVGTWLVFRDLETPTARPDRTPNVAQPDDPTPEPTTPGTDPSEDSVPPASTPPEGSVALPPPGTVIEPVAGCPATASDAVGEQGDDGRYASGAGLSIGAADGFVAEAVQIPWVHESNSQVKKYGDNWMAAVTVGTVRLDDGFTDTTTTAVAMVACMLGSDFYNTAAPVATVVNAARAPEGDAVALSVDVAVQNVVDVNSDLLYVMTIKQGDVMHVVISTVPDTDPEATDAVGAAVADVRLG